MKLTRGNSTRYTECVASSTYACCKLHTSQSAFLWQIKRAACSRQSLTHRMQNCLAVCLLFCQVDVILSGCARLLLQHCCLLHCIVQIGRHESCTCPIAVQQINMIVVQLDCGATKHSSVLWSHTSTLVQQRFVCSGWRTLH